MHRTILVRIVPIRKQIFPRQRQMPIPQPQLSINRSFMRDEVYDTLRHWS